MTKVQAKNMYFIRTRPPFTSLSGCLGELDGG